MRSKKEIKGRSKHTSSSGHTSFVGIPTSGVVVFLERRRRRGEKEEEIAILTKVLTNAAGHTEVNLGQLLTVCTTNALARQMLGKRVFSDGSSGVDPKSDDFKGMVVELIVLAGVFNIGDFVPGLHWLNLQGIAFKMKKLHSRFDAFLSEILEEHKTHLHVGADKNSIDLLSTLLLLLLLKDSTNAEAGDGEKLTDTEIKALLLIDLSQDLFTAGTDTSASTTEWAIAELFRHPKVMAQLQLEMDTVVGRNRLVSEADLPQLPYLQAVIKEVFRMHPSTPLSLLRMAAEECEIDGYIILKGSTLLMNVWDILRDPKSWADPLEFKPERFLLGGEKPNADIRGNDFKVIPFGAGRRICAGMSLGLRMVQILTASLVHAFDWGLPNGLLAEKLNMDEAYGLTLQRASPLVVHPKPRLDAHVYGAF
ncbi:flavonoid 3'-monooxygenase-like [Impatiens glandulifera]|uniref:flavonoid 3'-monooxygenase-like n=1 Tax=Impatiens glandulifera TaxID=253017 RepID=UPI001FB1877F|nr:flavonoid 3'-monooxygenase-like [Impatiens glandulifera]